MDIPSIIRDVMASFAGDMPEARFKNFVREHGLGDSYEASISSYWTWQQVCTTQISRILTGPRAQEFLEALAAAHPQRGSFQAALGKLEAFERTAADQNSGHGSDGVRGWGQPYRGLRPFLIEHAHLFFGRTSDITGIANQVSAHSLSALVGASGSGKSSVLRAGVCNQLGVEQGWRCLPFRLAEEATCCPFTALARQCVKARHPRRPELADEARETSDAAAGLRRGDIDIEALVAAVGSSLGEQQCLLILDQFEEIFAETVSETARKQFLGLLLQGFAGRTVLQRPRLRLLLSFRADFLDRLLTYPGWSKALQGRDYLLGPMDEYQLAEAIIRPAQLYGVAFEEPLVETLVSEVRHEAGRLPLLQFCLQEMWRKREERCRVDAIGGASQ